MHIVSVIATHKYKCTCGFVSNSFANMGLDSLSVSMRVTVGDTACQCVHFDVSLYSFINFLHYLQVCFLM